MRVSLSRIHRMVNHGKLPPGYIDQVHRLAKEVGVDKIHGVYVDLDEEVFSDLREEFRGINQIKVGDFVAAGARKMHIPFCGGCSRRRKKLNRYAFQWTVGKPWTMRMVRIG